MKYPQQQFSTLVHTLRVLKNIADLREINPSQLHFTVYQQHSEGQQHNVIGQVQKDGKIEYLRKHAANDRQDFVPLVEPDKNFLLYPEGCHDEHVETAVKKAIKLIYL